MNIFDRLFRHRREKALITPPTVPNRRTLFKSWLPHWIRGDYTLKNSELIFAAVSRIANALSAMPVQLFRASTPMRNDLNDIVGFSPNHNITSCNFFKTMEACRCTYGNAYAIKEFDPSGKLSGMSIADPSRITPILESDTGELWYKVTPDKGDAYYLHNFYVIYVPFISTNGYSGINPISVLLDTLRYNDEIQSFSASQLSKGVNAQIVIEAPANLGEQQKVEMINSFMETYRKTSGNILLLESGVTAKTLNLSPVDAKLFEVEKIARSRVAMVYNIPPHLLGDYSDTSFSSQEQQMLEFLTLTMLPIVTAYEQELNRKLISREDRKKGINFKFNIESILRADSATRANIHQQAIRGGWMTPNEVRAEYGMANDPNGRKLMVSKDLTTLEWLIANPSGAEKTNEGGT